MAAPSEAENEGLMRNMVELSAEEEVLLRSLQEVNTDMTATSPSLPVTNESMLERIITFETTIAVKPPQKTCGLQMGK